MSVLACDRYGCGNVMCDRLSYEHGYICNDCFTELVSRGADVDVREFMASVRSNPFKVNAYDRYNNIFPID